MAAALGISPTAAFRLLSHLKRTGVLRMISLPRLRHDACECVAYLGTDLMDAGACAALVESIRLDPAVAGAAQLSGRHELRLEAVHADVRAANAWFRDLMSHPGVTGGRLCFTRTVFRRWTHAAAILGAAEAQDTVLEGGA